MASIRERKLGNGKKAYMVRFRTADGTERAKTFSTKRDAQNYVGIVEVARRQGTLVDPRLGRITLNDWWDRWWPTASMALRPSTRSRDEVCFRLHIAPTFGTTQLGRIQRTDAREWAKRLSDEDGGNLSPASVTKIVQVFNKTMRAAVDDRMVGANPIDRLPVPRIEHTEMRYLNTDEVWRLADTIDPRYRSFVLLGAFSGLRLGEMLALRWGSVDMLGRRVSVTATLTDLNGHISVGPTKTKASMRRVSIPDFVSEALASIAPRSPHPNDLVFTSPEGHYLRPGLFRRRIWHPAVEEAGLAPLRIHDLRHTAVSLWIAAGANPKQVANRAGHTSVVVVLDRYGHLYKNHDDDLISALERAAPERRLRLVR